MLEHETVMIRRRLDRLDAVSPRLRELKRDADAFEAKRRELMRVARARHGFDVDGLTAWFRAGLVAGRCRDEASRLLGRDRQETMTEAEAWANLERIFPEIAPDVLRGAIDRLITLAEAPEPKEPQA